jgi:hypothetical protein
MAVFTPCPVALFVQTLGVRAGPARAINPSHRKDAQAEARLLHPAQRAGPFSCAWIALIFSGQAQGSGQILGVLRLGSRLGINRPHRHGVDLRPAGVAAAA